MRENKIKSSYFNENTGISTVTIDNKYGTFTGQARKNPLDGEKSSRFFGCQIAEIRAIRKSYVKQLQDKKVQLKTIKNFYSSLQQMRNYNEHDYAAHHARTMMRVYSNEITELQKKIASINAWLKMINLPSNSNQTEGNSN